MISCPTPLILSIIPHCWPVQAKQQMEIIGHTMAIFGAICKLILCFHKKSAVKPLPGWV
jgi:hypothetical protein